MNNKVNILPFNFFNEKTQTTKNQLNFIIKKINLVNKSCNSINKFINEYTA